MQIQVLKTQDWEKIDFEHLIENLKMGDPKETVESNLVVLIAHLLELDESWYPIHK